MGPRASSAAYLGLLRPRLVGSVLTCDNLVRATITGQNDVAPGQAEAGQSAALAPAWLAALVLATASCSVWTLVG